ncbi:MAG: AI-2E family transporter [Acidobacteriota bacterium]|jgi:predicted PurR-regulated permease PerM|nr:AI-2E family transporter [Acidobacteriota bacterium]
MVISVRVRQKRSLIFLLIVLAALLPFLLLIARPFWTAFVVAAIVAIVLHPLKERLRRRLRRPGVATFLVTAAAVLVLGVALTFAGFTITRELEHLYDGFSHDSLEEGGWPAFAAMTVDSVVDKLSAHLPVPIDDAAVRAGLLDGMKKASQYLLAHAGIAVSGIANFIANGVLMTVFLYFLLRYGRVWIHKLAGLTPLDPPVAATILKTIRGSVTANFNGMLAVIVGQGLLLILGFWLVGVRSPVLWGTVGGFSSIIPVVGSLLIWAPVAIGFLFQGAYVKALVLAAWGIVVVGSSDNILRSVVVGKQGNQHPVLVALAAIGGAYAFGFLGILLGPLVVALAAALVKEILRLSATGQGQGVGGAPAADAASKARIDEPERRLEEPSEGAAGKTRRSRLRRLLLGRLRRKLPGGR